MPVRPPVGTFDSGEAQLQVEQSVTSLDQDDEGAPPPRPTRLDRTFSNPQCMYLVEATNPQDVPPLRCRSSPHLCRPHGDSRARPGLSGRGARRVALILLEGTVRRRFPVRQSGSEETGRARSGRDRSGSPQARPVLSRGGGFRRGESRWHSDGGSIGLEQNLSSLKMHGRL